METQSACRYGADVWEDYFEVSEVPFLQVMSAQIKHTRHFIVSLHFKVYYIWVKWKLIWRI